MTFVQFLFVAVIGLPAQLDRKRPPFFLKQNKVPIRRWLINIVLFFSINLLNNHAFSYDISVPVHIILRSGGSITTMIAGSLYGKRYSRIQIVAVLLLTVGVITAAWSDAQSKVCCQLSRCGLEFGLTAIQGFDKFRSERSTELQRRARHSVHCASHVGNYGTVYRRDIPDLWPAVEGELVLLTPAVAASVSALPPIDDEAVYEAREQPATAAPDRRAGRVPQPLAQRAERTRQHPYPKPTLLPRTQRTDAVRLHSGRQLAGSGLVGPDGDHRAQHPQAGELALEHMALWKPTGLRDAGGSLYSLLCGRALLFRWEAQVSGPGQNFS